MRTQDLSGQDYYWVHSGTPQVKNQSLYVLTLSKQYSFQAHLRNALFSRLSRDRTLLIS